MQLAASGGTRRWRTAGGAFWLFLAGALAAGSGCRYIALDDPADQREEPASDQVGTRLGGLEAQLVGPVAEGERGGEVIVLLHGWGATGDDLVSLAELLAHPRLSFVVPAAPLSHPRGGRMWWPLDMEKRRQQLLAGKQRDLSAELPPGLGPARAKVLALLQEVRRKFDPRVLTVAGFSQGGMLAMDVALAADPPVDRVAVLSGTLLAEPVWVPHMKRLAASKDRPAVFVSHGRRDRILPLRMAERLRDRLRAHGFSVTWFPFADGHAIPPTVIDALGDFLLRPDHG